MIDENQILRIVYEYSIGSNFEILGTEGSLKDPEGLTFNCYDYLDKETDFESDVTCIMAEIIHGYKGKLPPLKVKTKIYDGNEECFESMDYTIKLA